jgi:hypothetical protein
MMRATLWIALPAFVLSLAGFLFLDGGSYPLLARAAGILSVVSFFLMFSWPFSMVFDEILNGLLRRFGTPAKATVIARHNTGISMGKVSHLWRVKLRVQPAEGEAFEAITEDQGSGGEVGEQVPVRYDPFTKSVAIERPWDIAYRRKDKDENF